MARITYTREVDDITVAAGVFDSELADRFEGDLFDLDESLRLEVLYLTDDGVWVLNVLDSSGFNSQYLWMDPDEAQTWLIDNRHPEAAQRYFSPQGGRPSKGTRVNTHIAHRTLRRVEDFAEQRSVPMPEALRQLIELGLDHLDVDSRLRLGSDN